MVLWFSVSILAGFKTCPATGYFWQFGKNLERHFLIEYTNLLWSILCWKMDEMVKKYYTSIHVDITFPVTFFVIVSGKTNGKGFYIYEKGSKPKPDPSVLPIVEESRQRTKITPHGKVHFFFRIIL